MNAANQLSIITFSALSALLCGCASTTATQPGVLANLIDEARNTHDTQQVDVTKMYPEYMTPYLKQNSISGLRDQVLVNMKAGISALEHGDVHITRRLMEDAYNRIETVYADNKAAKAARSNYVQESNKDFKGEPYERSMVGYYLGLTDLLSGDLQSAKASFSWGEFQDTLSEVEEYKSDMSSLVFLRGWAKHCEGERSDAKRDFDASGISPVGNANLLVLVESGKAPIKYAAGKHSEKLKFKAANKKGPGRLSVNYRGSELIPVQIEDLVFQATTRGGRQVDAVLAGKAEFKDSTKNVADGALVGAMAAATYSQTSSYMGDYDTAYNASMAGAALGLVSMFANVMSENTVPEADTRQWDNLPRFIQVQTLYIESPDDLSSIYLQGTNQKIPLSARATGQCYLAWHKMAE